MVDRIRQLLQARELSPTQFADTIGVARPIVSHILGGRNKPSLEVVQKIIAAFPDIALPWLLSGQGDMLAASPPNIPAQATTAAAEPTPLARPNRRPVRSAEAPEKAPLPAPAPPTPATTPIIQPNQAGAPAEPAPAAPKAVALKAAPGAEPDAAIAPLLLSSAKSIRRVLIFYSDGTFADFSPSQDAL